MKKFPSEVDGFTFLHFNLKVIASDVKVLCAKKAIKLRESL